MLPSTLLIELICCIIAMVYLRKNKSGWYWLFVPFMLFVVVAEATGYTMAVFFHKRNHWVYNVVMAVEMIFITETFKQIFAEQGIKGTFVLRAGFILFSTAFILESFENKIIVYNDKTDTLMSILFIIYSCIYFYQLLKMPAPVNITLHPPFWIVAGVFMFYFAGTAVNVFFEEIMQLNIVKGIPLRYLIFTVLNAILYGCWSYAFRCRHLQTISLSR